MGLGKKAFYLHFAQFSRFFLISLADGLLTGIFPYNQMIRDEETERLIYGTFPLDKTPK